MSFLFKLLPSWVPLALGGLLVAGLVAGYFGWQHHERALGAALVEAADAKAVAEQREKDARLSAELVARQAAELDALRNRAATIITRIERVPVTTGCGPVMRDASRGLQQLFTPGAGGPPAGRQPAAALR